MIFTGEAIEAAAIASYVRAGGGTPDSWPREEDHYRHEYLEDARVQLEAAAPFIAAQALREAVDQSPVKANCHCEQCEGGRDVIDWLFVRAAQMEPGE